MSDGQKMMFIDEIISTTKNISNIIEKNESKH